MLTSQFARFSLLLALGLVWGCSAPQEEVAAAPEGARVEPSDLVRQLRDMAWAEDVDAARSLIEAQRPHHDELSPEWLLGASWLGRGASFAERWDLAEQYAGEAYNGSQVLLASRELDADNALPLALGASIEVLGQARDAKGDRPGAVGFLEAQRARYRGTSIETRIQKNVLLLSLEGQPFPVLDVDDYLGEHPPSQDSLEGKVVVAFFWAHWCPDCKRELPVLERLHETYAERGLAIIGPTQLYGYTSRGQDATPEQEMAYLRGAYQERYPVPAWMSVPVSEQNFLEFGVSTTPTLVLIDREGIVRLYNPGNLEYEELAPTIERLLDS